MDFAEQNKLDELIAQHSRFVRAETLEIISVGKRRFPIRAVTLGSDSPEAPVLALFGGVHGLERVGSQAVLAYLLGLANRLEWDATYRTLLEQIKIVSIPILNPAGMFLGMRANANGVDLMRNAPQDAEIKTIFPISGHRVSSIFPWYRGKTGAMMETESQVLVDFCQQHLFNTPFSLSLDLHSGFGMRDRLWYPYACSHDDFPGHPQFVRMFDRFANTFPYHVYHVESQTDSYGIHGDLWDYLTAIHERQDAARPSTFIPLTLEMGSWRWVKKNPLQFFSKNGIFNPVKRHRYERTMRRHYPLLDFFLHATVNYQHWEQDP